EGLKLGKEIGLANKESLVIGGTFLKGWIEKGAIFPLDSEHFALSQLLKGRNREEVAQLIITASGGGIRDLELGAIPTATPAEVLNHPNWEMGAKITVDSATIVNKLFEVLEAYWLFGIPEIEGVIERNSLIHGGVLWRSGELSFHLSPPDMALPIGTFLIGEGVELVSPPQLPNLPSLSFQPIEVDRYPLWRLKPLLIGRPQLGVVLNTLDDYLVPLFLTEEIGFGKLLRLLEEGVLEFQNLPPLSRLEEIGEVKGRVLQWLFSRIGKEV
ncbi:MAG: 1-deoxy-D-xylulose-5-phosphate reductoisomerase, partial [Campylobacterales bacterium]